MKQTKEEQTQIVLQLLTRYYVSREKAEEWLDTEHRLLSNSNETPREMIERGNGKEVVSWLKMVLSSI